jgi:hypothetical protein
MRPGHPARLQAVLNALMNDAIGFGRLSPPRPFAAMRKNTHGTTLPCFFRRSSLGVLTFEQRAQFLREGKRAALAILHGAGSSLTSPALKSTRRRSRVSTSESTRRPVMQANWTTGRSSSSRFALAANHVGPAPFTRRQRHAVRNAIRAALLTLRLGRANRPDLRSLVA